MKRILTGFIMDGKAGGIDKYLLNFLEAVSGEDVRIDFLTNEVDQGLKRALLQDGSRLFPIASLRSPVRQYRQVCHILRKGQYDTTYLNVSTAIDCIAALAAYHCRVPVRIIHSHSSGNDCESAAKRIVYNVIHKICRLFLYRTGTKFYGCSQKAGLWLFPEKTVNSNRFQVVYNAVDRSRFSYDTTLQEQARKRLNVEGQLVVGHVGNFCYAKNYPFLIDVFAETAKCCPDAVFLLAGTGIELERVKHQVKEKGLEGRVRFLGWQKNTSELYHALDVLLLPSRFEGLPIVGVEAQCTKLACIMSASITSEAKIQDHCYFLDVKEGPRKWAEFIRERRGYDRNDVHLLDEAENYNLEVQKKQLQEVIK